MLHAPGSLHPGGSEVLRQARGALTRKSMCAGHTAPQRPGQGALFSPLPLTHAGESYLLHTISSSSPSPPIHSCYLWGKERWLLSHPRVKGSRKGGGECLSLSGVRARALANDPFSLGHWTPSSVPALRPPSCCQAGLQKMSGARGTSSTPRSHCLFHHHCPHPATPPLPIAFCPTPLSCEAGREKA